MGGRASLACRGRELRPLPRRRSAQEEAETMIQVRGIRSSAPARRGRWGGFWRSWGRGHPRQARRRPAGLGRGALARAPLRSAPPGAARGVRGSGSARLSPRRRGKHRRGCAGRRLGALRNSWWGVPSAQAEPGAAQRSARLQRAQAAARVSRCPGSVTGTEPAELGQQRAAPL